MDNRARLSLYARARLGGRDTHCTRLARCGGFIQREGRRLPGRGDRKGKAPSLKRTLYLGEKVFSDGAGLGRAQFPPIPQPGNRAKRVRGG